MRDILKKELIGAEITVAEAKNKANVGIEGMITDETRNTLTVETSKGMKKLIKKNITIILKKEGIKIDGEALVSRPEDRIKKK